MTSRWPLVALLALPGPAAGQEHAAAPEGVAPVASPAAVAPVISSVWAQGRVVRRAQPGQVVHLRGAGFLAPDGASASLLVEVDDQPGLVVECSPDHVGVLLPDALTPGVARVRVTRPDGAHVETELALVVVGTTGCLPNGLVLSSLLVDGQRAHRALPGDTLVIEGQGWPGDRPDGTHPSDLAVTLGDQLLHLVEATLGRLVVRLPEETPPGATTLAVRVGEGADRLLVAVPLEVVNPTWGAEDGPPRPPVAPPPVAAPARPAPVAPLCVSSFTPVQDAEGTRLVVEGTAPLALPDGFDVQVIVLRKGQELGARRVELRGGAWSASLDPVARGLEPGRYEVVVVFELSKQGKVKARRFAATLPDELRGAYDRLERRETFTVEPN